MLEGAGGASKVVRSSPPVLLPRQSDVALPNAAAVFEFSCEPSLLLHKLSSEPLLVELWHKDRYVSDLLLGIATVDMAEVLGVTPTQGAVVGGQPQTVREQERAVPVLTPDGPPPPPLQQAGDQGKAPPPPPGSRVAMLRVLLRLEELGPPPRPPPPRAPRASGLAQPGRGDAAALAAAAGGGGDPEGALAKWRRREEQKWRAALRAREEEALKVRPRLARARTGPGRRSATYLPSPRPLRAQMLAREWKVKEQRREEGVARQKRALLGLEAELRQRLEDVSLQARQLEQGEEELRYRKQQAEEKARPERHPLTSATALWLGHSPLTLAARAHGRRASSSPRRARRRTSRQRSCSTRSSYTPYPGCTP